MIYSNTAALPREELVLILVQGEGLNSDLIWKEILPEYPVDRRNAHLINATIATAELLRVADKVAAPGANVERITLTFGDQSFKVVIRKEEVLIPDEIEKDYGDYFSTEAFASRKGQERLDLLMEYLCAIAIFSTATFGAATNSLVAYTEANIATISFVADIYAAIEKVRDQGEQPNTVVIPAQVYQRIRRSSLVVAFVRGVLMAQQEVNTNTIQKAFEDEGIKKVVVGRARYNSAASGDTPSLQKVWPNTYIFVGKTGDKFNEEADGMNTVSGVGATVYWSEYGMREVQTYRDEPKESNVVRVKTSAIPYIANANAGTLIATQFA